jgi:hypothetical protein
MLSTKLFFIIISLKTNHHVSCHENLKSDIRCVYSFEGVWLPGVNDPDYDQSGGTDDEQSILWFPERAGLTTYSTSQLSEANNTDKEGGQPQLDTSRTITEADTKRKTRKEWKNVPKSVNYSFFKYGNSLHKPVRIPQTTCQMKPRKRCSECWKVKKRSETYWQCSVCSVGLHLNCFEKYHTFK